MEMYILGDVAHMEHLGLGQEMMFKSLKFSQYTIMMVNENKLKLSHVENFIPYVCQKSIFIHGELASSGDSVTEMKKTYFSLQCCQVQWEVYQFKYQQEKVIQHVLQRDIAYILGEADSLED